MKELPYILLGIGLAILELTTSFILLGIPVHISFVILATVLLLFSGKNNHGTSLVLTAALVLDIFSPYRTGYILLSYLLVFILLQQVLARSLEVTNPLIASWIVAMALFVLYIFELLGNPSLVIFLANMSVNVIIGFVLAIVSINFVPHNNNEMLVSRDVDLR